MSAYAESLIARVKTLDPALAEEIAEELFCALSARRVQDARGHLSSTIGKYSYDMTGQDGEDEINAAAVGYIDSQDAHIRETDPDRWSEMRMGC